MYIVERPVTTHTIVVRADRSVSAQLTHGDTGQRYPWVVVTRAQAARWIREAHASAGNPVERVKFAARERPA
jgi:hypothetical protein